MTKDEIKKAFYAFIEFPKDDNKSFVTTTSTLLFAEHIAALVSANQAGDPKKWLSWSAKCGEQAWDTQDEAELNSDEDFEPVPLFTRGSK